MALKKRNKLERERDREMIGRSYLRGKTQQEITDQLNQAYYQDNPLSRQQINYDIHVLIDRWKEESTSLIDQKKAIELAKVHDLETMYRDAWERSLQDAESTTLERNGVITNEDGEIIAAKVKQTKKREGQSGNPAYLQGIMNCIARRCEILGLNAPTSSRNVNVDLSTLTNEQLQRLAAGEDLLHVLATSGNG